MANKTIIDYGMTLEKATSLLAGRTVVRVETRNVPVGTVSIPERVTGLVFDNGDFLAIVSEDSTAWMEVHHNG